MIRNLSIKKKIVIWFSLSMVLIIGIMMWLTFAISQSVFSTDIQTQLVNQVNANAEEIEYLNSHELEEEYEAGDQFLEYKKGYLEIDDDFCDYENGIYTCLVDSENNLLYGVSPIRLSREEVFTYLDVKPLKYSGVSGSAALHPEAKEHTSSPRSSATPPGFCLCLLPFPFWLAT